MSSKSHVVWLLSIVVPALVGLTGCGSSGGSGSVELADEYFGYLEDIGPGGEDGALTVLISTPPSGSALLGEEAGLDASGTIDLIGSTSVELAGTFERDITPNLILEDLVGDYFIEADLVSGRFQGTYSGPGGSGRFDSTSDSCAGSALGSWTWENDLILECPGDEPLMDSETGYLELSIVDGELGGVFADDEGCSPWERLPGTCSGTTYTENSTESETFEGCTLTESSTTTLIFSGDTFSGSTIGTITSSANCVVVVTCEFSFSLTGSRTNDFPECIAVDEAEGIHGSLGKLLQERLTGLDD